MPKNGEESVCINAPCIRGGTPELKDKIKPDSDYWITTNVKTDKDGNTIVVLYIGCKESKDKVQFFIKPEKAQLTSDYKDMDSAKFLSKIEITLKSRSLGHNHFT